MKNENRKLFTGDEKVQKGSGNLEIGELPEEDGHNKSTKVGKVLFVKNFSKVNMDILKNGIRGR